MNGKVTDSWGSWSPVVVKAPKAASSTGTGAGSGANTGTGGVAF